jgi:signal transduction histidine kinase
MPTQTDGKKRTYNVATSPLCEKDKRPFGVVTTFMDVTSLAELDKMKSSFISTVSHELRTPLTSVKMGIELLLEEIPGSITEKQRELLTASKEDCDRLIRLINDLLDLSRLETGRAKMEFREANLVSLIEDVVVSLKSQGDEKGVDVVTEFPSQTIKCMCDVDRIREVVTNLVNNAIKFTDKGGVVTISAKDQDDSVLVSVKDTGIGIHPDNVEKIFSKFHRIESGYAYEEEGTGLGLAICKEIIEAHKGKIWVESEYLKGSDFMFTIPKSIEG